MKLAIATLLTLLFWDQPISASHVRSASDPEARDHHFPQERRLTHHQVHDIISTYASQNPPRALHPKYGSRMEEVLFGSKATSKVSVEVVFANPMTEDQAQILLKHINDIQILGCYHITCSVSIPTSQLPELTNLDEVLLIQYSEATTEVPVQALFPERHRSLVGKVNSTGDIALFANLARAKYGVNGSGILVGVLGESFNCYGGYANDTQTGDLPLNVTELTIFNATECQQIQVGIPIDQVRAMMQLVYDVAPGANFAFINARGGSTVMAAAIRRLVDIGCNIITSSLSYNEDPFFQNSVIRQALEEAVSNGVAFFPPAGEYARLAWDAPAGFVPVSVNGTSFSINGTNATTVYHQFGIDSNGKPIISQRVAVQNFLNSPVSFVMQWDEPFFFISGAPGCQVDLDIYFLRNNTVVTQSTFNNIGRSPSESIFIQPSLFTNISGGYATFDIVIVKKGGISPKYVKIIPFAPVVDVKFEFATNTATVTGYKNSNLAGTTGAAAFFQTPAFGVSPPVVQFFSAVGGVPIVIDKSGNRLSTPEIARVPRFVGPDSVQTTFYTNGPQGLYYGTTPAAAHVVGVAALMLQLTGKNLKPLDVYGILERTAIDMNDNSTAGFDTGFDFATGYGFVNASAALDATVAYTRAPTKAPTTAPTQSPVEPPTNCGFLNLNIFCPFECGLFKRIFGIGGC